MNRPRRVRRARQLRGLKSRTKTRSSNPQLATHSHDAGQPRQAMLGAGARAVQGAGRGVARRQLSPGPHVGNLRAWGPAPCTSQRGDWGRSGPAPLLTRVRTRPLATLGSVDAPNATRLEAAWPRPRLAGREAGPGRRRHPTFANPGVQLPEPGARPYTPPCPIRKLWEEVLRSSWRETLAS